MTPGHKSVRCANMEAYRCLLMFLIVWCHSYQAGIYRSSTELWTLLFTVPVIWHVDAFVALSGWFGIKWSWRKFFRLWGSFAFYSASALVYAMLSGVGTIKVMITGGWFGGTYLMLLMMAPLLNICLERLVSLPRREIWCAWGLFALAMFFSWSPRGLLSGVQAEGICSGYSIISFVFIYISVRLMRLLNLPFSKKQICAAVFTFLGMVVLIGISSIVARWMSGRPIIVATCFKVLSTYNAPHVLIMAVAATAFFARFIQINGRVAAVFRFIAPSMFGVYLCHATTPWGLFFMRSVERHLAEGLALHPVFTLAISAVVVFFACLIVDLFRRGLFFQLNSCFQVRRNNEKVAG